MPDDLFAGRARTDDQRAMIIQLSENTLGKLYAGKRHRNWTGAQFRFVANALAHFQSGLKHAVEDRARFAPIQRNLVGVAHLAQNFRFPEQHRIEPCRDAEQVPHGAAVPVPVERAIQLGEGKLVEGRHEQFHRARAIRRVLAGYTVEFAAIAGRENQRFLKDAARTQLFGGFAGLLRRESEALPQIDRGRPVIQSNKNDFHL